MTRRIPGTAGGPNVLLIEEEAPDTCELCGEEAELRPYGPGGKRICFNCAMEDREGTERRFSGILNGGGN
jgi:hypothetical protein